MAYREKLKIKDAKIKFRNFAGKPDKFNKAGGKRYFSVVLSKEQADQLAEEGFNVKVHESNEYDEPMYTLKVIVNFDCMYPPSIYQVADGNVTLLDEETVAVLDTSELISCDMVLQPRDYETNGRRGVSVYLKTLFANIEVDEFAAKYNLLGTRKGSDFVDADIDGEVPFN